MISSRSFCGLSTSVRKQSPVVISAMAHPKLIFQIDNATSDNCFWIHPRCLASRVVPGVTTRITSLFTSPFACFGSSTCSQIATLCPFSISRLIYVFGCMKRNPAHRCTFFQSAVLSGQCQFQFFGYKQCIIKKHLIKVAQSVKQDAVLVYFPLFYNIPASSVIIH